MKYVSFRKDGQIRIGVRMAAGIIDLSAAAGCLVSMYRLLWKS